MAFSGLIPHRALHCPGVRAGPLASGLLACLAWRRGQVRHPRETPVSERLSISTTDPVEVLPADLCTLLRHRRAASEEQCGLPGDHRPDRCPWTV